MGELIDMKAFRNRAPSVPSAAETQSSEPQSDSARRVAEHSERIVQIQRAANKLRNTVKARFLRLPDIEDGDPTAWDAIDFAARPQESLNQCDDLLAQARVALQSERWDDLYRLLDQAQQIPMYLEAAEGLFRSGHFIEVERSIAIASSAPVCEECPLG